MPGHELHDVAVVGAGTTGSSIAYQLAQRGLGLGVSELVCDGDVHSFDWSGLRFGRFA